MATQFHYNGTTFDLDPAWDYQWYVDAFLGQLAKGKAGGHDWGWFWIDQASNRVVHFRLSEQGSYAFSGDAGSELLETP
jgi:hypothetical protein